MAETDWTITKSRTKLVIHHVEITWKDDTDAHSKAMTANYLLGYFEAVSNFSAWKDGHQVTGVLREPMREVMKRKAMEFPDIESVVVLR